MELPKFLYTQPKPSSCLADVGLFVRPKSQQSPSNKESSYKLKLSSQWKTKYSIEIQLFTVWGRHANCSRPHLYTVWEAAYPLQRSITAKYLTSQIALQGPIALFLRHWGDQAHCAPFVLLGGLTLSNITHRHD